MPAPILAADPSQSVSLPLPGAAVITISARVRFSRTPTKQYSMIAGILSNNPGGGYTDVGCSKNGVLQTNTYGPGFWKAVLGYPDLSDGQFHQVTFQLYQYSQSTKLKIYIDGVKLPLEDSSPPAPDPNHGVQQGQTDRNFLTTLVIGDTDGIRFEGDIETFEVWLRELAEAECLAL